MANRALLIGINAYKQSPLRGCINDVLDIRQLLITKLGFVESEIRILAEAQATTANIQQQITGWLVWNAQPGDRLLFHFSGHGTQIPGKDGVVYDVICPYDFDFTDETSLSDVEFSQMFHAVPMGAEFNWISDSCHSGLLARSLSPNSIPRYLPPPPKIQAQIDELRKRAVATRGLHASMQRLKGVLIAGCKQEQTSADAIIEGRPNGALTYYLTKELNSEGGLTRDLKTVHAKVQHAVKVNGYTQEPQLRGLDELLAKPFLGHGTSATVAVATVATASVPAGAGATTTASATSVAMATTTAAPQAAATAATLQAAPTVQSAPAAPTAADDLPTLGLPDVAGGTSMDANEISEARGWTERYEPVTRDIGDDGPTGIPREAQVKITKEQVLAKISPEAHKLVIAAEIGSKADYDRKYKHPEWPGGASGVTVGFGYDIGQLKHSDLNAAWDGLISERDFGRLGKCVGITGIRAKALLSSVIDITIPWEVAEKSYLRYTCENYGRQVISAFPNAMELHPHCFGALYSLVYNRGTSMSGERRAEMRNIRDLMAKRRFDQVPAQFRAMKRIWVGQFAGLVKRREDEAKLFERGLAAKPEPVVVATAPTPAPAKPVGTAPQPPAAPAPAAPVSAPAAAAAPAPSPTPAPIPTSSPAPAPAAAATPATPAPATMPTAPGPVPAAATSAPATAAEAAIAMAQQAAAAASTAAVTAASAAAVATPAAPTVPAPAPAPAPAPTPAAAPAEPAASPTPVEVPPELDPISRELFLNPGDGAFWDDDFEKAETDRPLPRGDEWGKVKWITPDKDSTEYRHIKADGLIGSTFEVTPASLDLLIKANSFEPLRTRDKIIFALRGAELVVAPGGSQDDKTRQVNRSSILLRDTRPNHQHFRCVIGVYDLAQKKLSAYIASTVPCRQAVYGYANGGDGSNMLPTGCYRYVVGPHKDRQGCLRQDENFCVLRSRRNYSFDTKDNWDDGFPADNLHPAFSNPSAQFSSWGCQTIQGNHDKSNGSFSGEYNRFRDALQLKPRSGDHGLKFSYVMLTGLEAALAASLLKAYAAGVPDNVLTEKLGRLRHGSTGERVKALQAKLGRPATGRFDSATKKALAEHQKAKLGWADGVYGPEMDGLLGLDIFKPAPAPVAVQPAAQPQPPPQVQPAPSVQPAPAVAATPTPAAPVPAASTAPASTAPAPTAPASAEPVAPAPAAAPAVVPAAVAAAAPAVAAAAPAIAAAAPAAPALAPTPAPAAPAPATPAPAAQAPAPAPAAPAAPLTPAQVAMQMASAEAPGVETERGFGVLPELPQLNPKAVKRDPAKRLALIIGNSAYQIGGAPLPHPIKDAELISKRFAALKYTVVGGGGRDETGRERNGINLSLADMRARCEEFLASITEGTQAVIYYAGHGVQVHDVNYMVPVDATLTSPLPLRELLPLNDLLDKASQQAGASGRVVLLLDACRDNPLSQQQLAALDKEATARNLSLANNKPAPAKVGGASRSLGTFGFDNKKKAAKQFIAYATAPGAVAFDGLPSDKNSPFASALARHIPVRGLPLEDLIDRVGLDVQSKVDSMGYGVAQDPWTSTNLKEPFYFRPRVWRPMFAMAALGAIAGAITTALIFPGGKELIDPFTNIWAWFVGLIFSAVLAIGTMLWGSAASTNSTGKAIRDVVLAMAGSAIAFAMALAVLQMLPAVGGTVKPAAAQLQPWQERVTGALQYLIILTGIFMFLGTIVCWEKQRSTVNGWVNTFIALLLPGIIAWALYSLQRRLFQPGELSTVMVSMIAGVLLTAGTALGMKAQRGVFRGFSAVTGSVTIGLILAIFFDVYYRFAQGSGAYAGNDPQIFSVLLGAAWYGLLGAQIGYCFTYYVAEHEPMITTDA